jgi:hypothetical protein
MSPVRVCGFPRPPAIHRLVRWEFAPHARPPNYITVRGSLSQREALPRARHGHSYRLPARPHVRQRCGGRALLSRNLSAGRWSDELSAVPGRVELRGWRGGPHDVCPWQRSYCEAGRLHTLRLRQLPASFRARRLPAVSRRQLLCRGRGRAHAVRGRDDVCREQRGVLQLLGRHVPE